MRKEILEFHAEFCRTFSNPKRLEILDLLKSGEMTVSALTEKLGVPKANVSQHLAVMRMMRILKTRRGGTNLACPLNISLFEMAPSDLVDGVKVADPAKYYKEVAIQADMNLTF